MRRLYFSQHLLMVMMSSVAACSEHPVTPYPSAWHRADDGARVETYESSDTLRLPHDVVDPTERGAKPSVTEPVILALLYGRRSA